MIITITEKEIREHPNEADLGKYIKEKYHEINQSLYYDRCVECMAYSPYLKSHNIEHRIGYVEGAGQGCFRPSVCRKS